MMSRVTHILNSHSSIHDRTLSLFLNLACDIYSNPLSMAALMLSFLIVLVLATTGRSVPHHLQDYNDPDFVRAADSHQGKGYGREQTSKTANKMWRKYERFDENKLAIKMQDHEKLDDQDIPQYNDMKEAYPMWVEMEEERPSQLAISQLREEHGRGYGREQGVDEKWQKYEGFDENKLANKMQDYEKFDESAMANEMHDYEKDAPQNNDMEVPYPMWVEIEEERQLQATSQSSWTKSDGILVDTASSISIDWGVNMEGKVFFCERPCRTWVFTMGILKQVDASDREIWGVNYDNKIFHRPIDNSQDWTYVEGRLVQVSASGNGYIWGVNMNNDVYQCRKPCPTGYWVHVNDKKLKQVDGGIEFVFGLDLHNQMFRRAITGTGHWEQVPTGIKMKYLTVGVNHVYGISEASGQQLYKCELPCNDGVWSAIPSPPICLEQIDASYNEIIGTTHGGDIFHINI